MDPRALAKARSRLRAVGKAVGELEAGGDFSDFTDTWFAFLTAFKSTYTTLEQGAKASPQSRQWFGAMARNRREDDLLQYLYQARNDEEHGLEDVAKEMPGRATLEIKVPANLGIDLSRVQFMGDKARSLNGDFARVIENIRPRFVLVPVHDRDRSRTVYQPPVSHLGAPLSDTSPLGVAKIAQTYLEALINEAEGLK